MEVGCYSIDLYCDKENDAHEFREFPHTYTGWSRAGCRRQAMKDGLTFGRDESVVCPKCKQKRGRR